MKALCPYCDWPEFAPEHSIESGSRGLFGWLFRRRGKIVRCARCTRQYAIGESGAYKIVPERATLAAVPPAGERKPEPPRLVDEDQAEVWR